MHPLDNVIWQALTTRQAHFAETGACARRFVREISPLSAFEEPSSRGYSSLSELVSVGATTAVFLDEPYQARSGWEWVTGAPLLQMVCENGNGQPAPQSHAGLEIVQLTTKDSAEMLELTSLTKPGPFGTRTHELGDYVGIRDDGKLVAMAGERLKVPGHTEVSAVCTHPEYGGKGYARLLMSEIMQRIRNRGEKPFLHVRCDNTRAIELYKKLGFSTRKETHFAVLRRSEPKC